MKEQKYPNVVESKDVNIAHKIIQLYSSGEYETYEEIYPETIKI